MASSSDLDIAATKEHQEMTSLKEKSTERSYNGDNLDQFNSSSNNNNTNNSNERSTTDLDLDFSFLEVPGASDLNFDSFKHKRNLSQKGSIAHRRKPRRATIQPNIEDTRYMDSTEPRTQSQALQAETVSSVNQGSEAGSRGSDDNVSEASARNKRGGARTIPGLLEGLRQSQMYNQTGSEFPGKKSITATSTSGAASEMTFPAQASSYKPTALLPSWSKATLQSSNETKKDQGTSDKNIELAGAIRRKSIASIDPQHLSLLEDSSDFDKNGSVCERARFADVRSHKRHSLASIQIPQFSGIQFGVSYQSDESTKRPAMKKRDNLPVLITSSRHRQDKHVSNSSTCSSSTRNVHASNSCTHNDQSILIAFPHVKLPSTGDISLSIAMPRKGSIVERGYSVPGDHQTETCPGSELKPGRSQISALNLAAMSDQISADSLISKAGLNQGVDSSGSNDNQSGHSRLYNSSLSLQIGSRQDTQMDNNLSGDRAKAGILPEVTFTVSIIPRSDNNRHEPTSDAGNEQ